jgi:membrane associated rhomboid family serine protease
VPFLLEAIRARIGGGAKTQAIIVGLFTAVLAVQNLDALRPGSPGAIYLLFGMIWVAMRLREWRQASVLTPQGFRDMMRVAEQSAAMRRIPVVYLRWLAGMIAAVGAAQLLASGSGAPAFGIAPAMMVPEYIRAGETWRLLTAGYLHGNIIHFAVNFMALLSLGRETEVLAHRAYLALVFLAAVLGGSLASFAVPPDVPSVGASGGLMGLIGFLGVLGYRRRETVPAGFLKMVLLNVAVIAGIGIVGMGLIDNAAHAGGLAVGALLGALFIPTTRARPQWTTGGAVQAAGVAAMVVLALGCAWTLVLVLLPVL